LGYYNVHGGIHGLEIYFDLLNIISILVKLKVRNRYVGGLLVLMWE